MPQICAPFGNTVFLCKEWLRLDHELGPLMPVVLNECSQNSIHKYVRILGCIISLKYLL